MSSNSNRVDQELGIGSDDSDEHDDDDDEDDDELPSFSPSLTSPSSSSFRGNLPLFFQRNAPSPSNSFQSPAAVAQSAWNRTKDSTQSLVQFLGFDGDFSSSSTTGGFGGRDRLLRMFGGIPKSERSGGIRLGATPSNNTPVSTATRGSFELGRDDEQDVQEDAIELPRNFKF